MREGYISAAAFPLVAVLRLNRTRTFSPVDTKTAFTVASLLLGMVKVTDRAPPALIWLYHNPSP
jgi:hypothetical protein